MATYRHDEQWSDVEQSKVDHVKDFRTVDSTIGHTDRLGGLSVLHRHRVHVDELGQRVDGRRDPDTDNDQLVGE